MVNRRTVLLGFLAVPAVVFANRALPAQRTSWYAHDTTETRALWGQVLMNDKPYGSPFRMRADPASKGQATLRNLDQILLPVAPEAGPLRVEVYSDEYGVLGSTDIHASAPLTAGCDVRITSFVMR